MAAKKRKVKVVKGSPLHRMVNQVRNKAMTFKDQILWVEKNVSADNEDFGDAIVMALEAVWEREDHNDQKFREAFARAAIAALPPGEARAVTSSVNAARNGKPQQHTAKTPAEMTLTIKALFCKWANRDLTAQEAMDYGEHPNDPFAYRLPLTWETRHPYGIRVTIPYTPAEGPAGSIEAMVHPGWDHAFDGPIDTKKPDYYYLETIVTYYEGVFVVYSLHNSEVVS